MQCRVAVADQHSLALRGTQNTPGKLALDKQVSARVQDTASKACQQLEHLTLSAVFL